eukprot:8929737-Ditylum_brightwellii.AAC.1
MRDITTEEDLTSHVMETNKWTTETFSWTYWPTFQRCKSSMDQQDNQIVKLTHDILPTNSQIHKYDKSVPDKCTFVKHFQI